MSRSQKIMVTAAFAVLVLALFAVLAYGLANRSSATGRSGMTRVGKPAPDFAMRLLDAGQTGSPERNEFRLSDHEGTPVVINFWASWCPPCRQESPGFERLWRRYRDSGIQFVGVDIQDEVADAEAYVREFGLTFPNGLDPDGKITIEYGVIGLPVTFFIGSSGIVEGRWVGAIPEDKLEEWVNTLLADSGPGGVFRKEGRTEGAFQQLR